MKAGERKKPVGKEKREGGGGNKRVNADVGQVKPSPPQKKKMNNNFPVLCRIKSFLHNFQ